MSVSVGLLDIHRFSQPLDEFKGKGLDQFFTLGQPEWSVPLPWSQANSDAAKLTHADYRSFNNIQNIQIPKPCGTPCFCGCSALFSFMFLAFQVDQQGATLPESLLHLHSLVTRCPLLMSSVCQENLFIYTCVKTRLKCMLVLEQTLFTHPK